MTFLIGGFSVQQYKSYLISNQTESQKTFNFGHSIAHLHLSCFPTIAILVNRLAYYVLHHFAVCPNNAYLFQKFKSHTFSEMKSQEEYNAVKEIFILFKNCPGLDSTQLIVIETQINAAEEQLKGEKKAKEEKEEEVDDVVDITHQKKELEILNQKKETLVDEASKTIQVKTPELATSILKKDVTEGGISEDGDFTSDDDVFDADVDDQPPSDEEEEFQSPQSGSEQNKNVFFKMTQLTQHDLSKTINRLPTIFESGASEMSSYMLKEDEENSDSDSNLVDLKPTRLESQFEKIGGDETEVDETGVDEEETEATVNHMNLIGNLEFEKDELNSENTGPSVDETIKWPPLPDYVVGIVNKKFPYQDLNSIHDLFSKENKARLLDYQRDLQSLLKFENKLRVERIWTEDERFHVCMDQYHDAFMKAYEKANKKTQQLHNKFVEKFPGLPVELGEKGEIICSIDQFKWVFEVIARHFPAIYHLAFDAPSFDIYQTRQLTAYVRAIFVGPDAHIALPAVETDCLIYIKETVGKTTPSLKFDSQNQLSKKSSFIYSYFVGPNGKIPTEPNEIKKQLQGLAKSYVRDWLERDGAILEFGGISIESGQTDADIFAGEWVRHMRAHYTQTLKSMDSNQLNEEIQKAYNCPLIGLVSQAYAGELIDANWIASTFPKEIMEKLFHHELQHAQEEIQQGIQNLINEACFEESKDVELLANRASVSEALVESLIRIRVFYIMCCLGQNAIEPVVRDLNFRAKNMHISAVSETDEDSTLVCQSRERLLRFNDTFDALEMDVKTDFKDPNKVHVLAKGHSVMKINSISQYNKEKIEADVIELKDLSFSPFSSIEQMRYLVAQIDPKTLVAYVQDFSGVISNLYIYEKVKKYEKQKEDHHKPGTGFFYMFNKNLFNPKQFQDTDSDWKALNNALYEVRKIENILNAKNMLEIKGQLNSKDQEDLKLYIEFAQKAFSSISAVLKEIYPEDHLNFLNALIRQKANDLDELANAEMEILRSDSKESKESSGASTPISSEDESVIGRKVKSPKKGLFFNAMNLLIGETTEVKFLRWKIERYEDLILASQEKITQYIESQSEWGNIDNLLIKAQKDGHPDWMDQILPLLKFCNKNVRIDEGRLNPDYLEDVRKAYTDEMLRTLRNAAQWAKTYPHMPGTEHINAICHQLYTTIDINDRCESVFKTFIKFGEKAMNKKKEFIPQDPRYALIADLYNSHTKICAVPFSAKAPILNQIGNSLKGHFNVAFDPNMQSNPMHVFCTRIIKRKDGEHVVKDIAMGTPTIENGLHAVQIAPEFEGMLRHYQENGLVHLYINNQNFISKGLLNGGGNEAPRCQALHDLAENHFKDTLYVVTLNQNSSFYHQRYDISKQVISLKGVQSEPEMDAKTVKEALIDDLLNGKAKNYLPSHLIKNETLQTWMKSELDKIHTGDFYGCVEFKDETDQEDFIQVFHGSLRQHVENLLKEFPAPNGETFGYSPCYSGAKEFKDELITQIFHGNRHDTGNHIPNHLVKKFNLRDWSLTTINQIHEKLFGDRKNLTAEERRIFIRLFYHNLSRKILIETKANSSNVSCKDRIDRGAESDAEDFAYLAILANCMNEPHVIDFFKMMIFSRAIIVRKRSILEERLERLIETVKFMIDHQAGLQELHQTLFPDIEITIDQFIPKAADLEVDIAELD